MPIGAFSKALRNRASASSRARSVSDLLGDVLAHADHAGRVTSPRVEDRLALAANAAHLAVAADDAVLEAARAAFLDARSNILRTNSPVLGMDVREVRIERRREQLRSSRPKIR